MKVFHKDYVTVFYFEDKSLVVIKWHGFANSAEYRALLDKLLEVATTTRAKHWLADNTNMRVIRPVDQEYTNTVWFPEFIKTDIQKLAIVTSTDFFNRLAVDKILTRASGIIKFDTMYFDNMAEALEWLGVSRDVIKQDA
jgi:hypothetical protein